MLAADESGADRNSVLRDLRAARRSIDEQQQTLREQAHRIDELIAQVADGGTLSPLPTVLARFHDDLEGRIRATGQAASDEGLQVLRTERRLLMILASRGMVPAGAGPYVEGLDEAERDECARQLIAFARLDETGEAGALQLAQDTWALALRHKEQILVVLDGLPGGPLGRALWDLAEVLAGISYSQRAQRVFTTRLLELMLTDPDFAATIRILLGLHRPDAGSVRVLGRDPAREASSINREISYVPGDVTLWPNLTGGQVLDALAGLRGRRDRAREEELMERFDLDPSKKVRTCPKGNRQKIALVTALAAPTRLLVLDEPTSGLDPLMERAFTEEMACAAAQGRTVLLSSHILAEVQHLCSPRRRSSRRAASSSRATSRRCAGWPAPGSSCGPTSGPWDARPPSWTSGASRLIGRASCRPSRWSPRWCPG